ncbi:MAG TPA: VgrG-related protein [Dehalococcoidia bacterium]|nr:VgrG-related protein [Dehalococcoidia bacterium]
MVATPTPTAKRLISQAYVKLDGTDLTSDIMADLLRVRVEGSVHLPDMAILEFDNSDLKWSEAERITIGQEIKVYFGDADLKSDEPVFAGEVAGMEIDVGMSGAIMMRIRGYDRAHRLHRGRITKVFKDVTDSDIAQEVASAVGLKCEVQNTPGKHPWVLQNNQTNWEFLQERAALHGYEVQVRDKTLVFKPPPSTEREAIDLEWNRELLSFRATMATGEQVNEVQVRGWDPLNKETVVGVASNAKNLPILDQGKNDGGQVAESAFQKPAKMVIARQPIYSQDQADRLAQTVLNELAGTFITAQGIAMGNPKLQLGSEVNLKSVGKQFTGKYMVTQITHRYEPDGYLIDFEVTGRRSTDLISLVSQREAPAMHVLTGVVSNSRDDETGPGIGRVKVKFPQLGDDIESYWCRLVAPGAGPDRGIEFIPEVDDEVLVVGSSMDNLYVLGGLWNSKDLPPYKSSAAAPSGSVEKRAIRTRTGHEILLDDGSSGGITIIDSTGNNKVQINTSDNSLKAEVNGDITIKSKTGSITIDAALGLTVKAGTNFSAEATGNAAIKGNGQASLEGTASAAVRTSGVATLSGSAVSLG